MSALQSAFRAVAIFWTLARYRLFWALYRDIVRGHLSNPHCGCEADARMTRRAARLRNALERLGPTFIKLGQFLSRRPDLFPVAYLEALAELQEEAPSVPFAEVRRRLQEVCICGHGTGAAKKPTCLHCRGIEEVFDSFEPQPIASASLAQVHRAVYRGERVAVKLLKPGVLDRLNADLALLHRLAPLMGRALGTSRNVDSRELIAEFRRGLLDEVNFENEALNIERFRDSHPNAGAVRAPAVYWEFERADMLVLECIEGVSLRAWRGAVEERQRLARVLARDFIQQVFIDNFFHADPHPGNLIVQADGRVVYLDFGAVGALDRPSRRALLRLLQSIMEDDPDLAVEAVLEVGGTDRGTVDVHALRSDVDRIIQLYRRRGGARWSDAVVQATRRHGLRLPRSILLYAKATMLNEALVRDLDPTFELLPVAREMVAPIIGGELEDLLKRTRRDLARLPEHYAALLRDLPELLRVWLSQSESGSD